MATNNSWNSQDPAQVAKGGTGAASHTAYAVLCGGTTSTGPIQSIASVGNAGEVLKSNGAGALPSFQVDSSGSGTLGTPQATTSGTTFLFTGIPSGTKTIHVNFDQVSTDGTDALTLQLGTSGGLEATGYVGNTTNFAATNVWSTSIIVRTPGSAALVYSGRITLTLLNQSTNTWTATTFIGADIANVNYGAGVKSLAGTLDRLQLAASGANTFDNGQVNILYYS